MAREGGIVKARILIIAGLIAAFGLAVMAAPAEAGKCHKHPEKCEPTPTATVEPTPEPTPSATPEVTPTPDEPRDTCLDVNPSCDETAPTPEPTPTVVLAPPWSATPPPVLGPAPFITPEPYVEPTPLAFVPGPPDTGSAGLKADIDWWDVAVGVAFAGYGFALALALAAGRGEPK